MSYCFEAFALPRPFCLGALEQEEEEEEKGSEKEEGGGCTHPGPCWDRLFVGWSRNKSLAKKRRKGAEVNIVIANGTQLEFPLCKRWEP